MIEDKRRLSLVTIAGALLVCLVTAVAYLPALRGGFVWDDDSLVTRNTLLWSVSGLRKIWFSTEPVDYWPVTGTAFWLQWHLWGLHALGYHAVNVALHIGEALLLWAVLRRLSVRGAYLAAFLFAVHPVNVETVAWISELKNLMAMLFFLLSIWFFLGFEAGGATRPCAGTFDSDPSRRRGNASPHLSSRLQARAPALILSLFSFILAMLSKGSVAVLPLILLGLIRWRRPIERRDLLAVAPFFVVSAIGVVVDLWFQRHGSAMVFRHAGFLERLLGAGAVIWFYLGKALWPAHLVFVYPEWNIRAADPLWWIPLLAALALTAVLWRSRRLWARPALFAWGYFCVSLVPVMGFTDVYFMRYSLVADHYEHLALIGVVALVATEISNFGFRTERSDRCFTPNFVFRFPLSAFRFGQIAATAAICLLAALTFRQCRLYRDSETLFRATIERNPNSWNSHTNLGVILFGEGRVDEAIDHYKAALQLKPDLIEAANDLGLALATRGRLDEARAYLETALSLKPDSFEAHYNLGLVMLAARRFPEAVVQFSEVQRLRPDFAFTDFNLGYALDGSGRAQDAIAFYMRALRQRRDFPEAQNGLGNALVRLGRLREAVPHYEAAVRMNPNFAEAHINLGAALARLGRYREARSHLEKALSLRPGDSAILAKLALLPAVQ